MPKQIVFIFLLMSLGLTSLAQTTSNTTFKKHTIEFLYPNNFYFDNRFRLSIPITNMGVKYQYFKSNKNLGFHLSVTSDRMKDFTGADYTLAVTERLILYPSLGLDFITCNKKNFRLITFIELNHRLGQIDWFAHSNEFEIRLGSYELLDFGTSIGASFTYKPPNKALTLSMAIAETFYFYRYDKGIPEYYLPGSPKHVLSISFGAGWTFGDD
ncbi:hypothetical protein [Crocinitomix catalasitica]|uniref:hypothetical protein n=1 Tax=Crocinitomix catalasitica TaxID=184607 RepID=UPI0012F98528|nr:hypothetical protein [Crocinitomix catalasitica]